MIKKILSAVISILIAYAIVRLAFWIIGIMWDIALLAIVVVLAIIIYFAISNMFKK